MLNLLRLRSDGGGDSYDAYLEHCRRRAALSGALVEAVLQATAPWGHGR